MPTNDNPVVHLAAAIAKIGAYSPPVHYTSIVERYFEGLAPLDFHLRISTNDLKSQKAR
jgi:hypothetical protein